MGGCSAETTLSPEVEEARALHTAHAQRKRQVRPNPRTNALLFCTVLGGGDSHGRQCVGSTGCDREALAVSFQPLSLRPTDVCLPVEKSRQSVNDGGLGVVRTEADLAHLRKHTQPRVAAAATPNG